MITHTKQVGTPFIIVLNVKRLQGILTSFVISFVMLIGLFSLVNGQGIDTGPNLQDTLRFDEEYITSNSFTSSDGGQSPLPNLMGRDQIPTISNVSLNSEAQMLNDLVVSGVFYVDDERYSVSNLIQQGASSIPYPGGLNFVAGDEILIIDMQGDNSGQFETVFISTVNANSFTLSTPLNYQYDGAVDKIMVQRVPHYGSVTVESGGTLTAHNWDGETGGVVFLRAENVTVQSGGAIDSSEKGYLSNQGPGLSIEDIGDGRHGGYGYEQSANLKPYGNPYQPIHLGSGGYDDLQTSCSGNGGGVVRLAITNVLTIYGSILSNGQIGSNCSSEPGGGAGGSIWIEATTINGNGLIQANGNDGGIWEDLGPGGSGGRIAIYAATGNYLSGSSLQAFGGNQTQIGDFYGSAGTIYTSDYLGDDTLRVDNDNNDGPLTGLPTNNYIFNYLYLGNNAHLEVDGPLMLEESLSGSNNSSLLVSGPMTTTMDYFEDVAVTVMGDMFVTETITLEAASLDIHGKLIGPASIIVDYGGSINLYAEAYPSGTMTLDELYIVDGTLTLAPYKNDNTDYTDDYGFVLQATNITVDSDGVISADGLGYGSEQGPGTPAIHQPNPYQAGAGHGGQGGQSFDNLLGGGVYGNEQAPTTLGSGGGGNGGVGGGAIHLIANDTIVLNGIVSAVGESFEYPYYYYGGGSGGSVWIETPILNGSGIIQANGGRSSDVTYSGGGGGGRISLITSDGSFDADGTISANGGLGYEDGENGSIYTLNIDPISGLVAISDSPTQLGNATIFTATIDLGTSVSYLWDFGDGNIGTGANTSHIYNSIGEYIVVVTATNPISSITETINVSINPPNVDADLVLDKTGPATAVAGTSIDYEIQVSNVGTEPASNVIVVDTLPASSTVVTSSHAFTLENNTITWHIPFLPGEARESIMLEIKTDVDVTGPITNQVTGTMAFADPNTADNEAGHTVIISPPPAGPDIAVNKTGPSSVPVGFPIKYNLTIVNQGGQLATGVIVTDTLPLNTVFISSTHALFNTFYNETTRDVTFGVGTLAPGQTYKITLYAQVTETAPLGDITNYITATLNESDENVTNNYKEWSTTVVAAAPSLTVEPTTSLENPAVLSVLENGPSASMVITITNKGTAALEGGFSLADIDTTWLNVFPLTYNDELAIGESVTVTFSVADTDQVVGIYYDPIIINSPDHTPLEFFLQTYVHPELTNITILITNDLSNPVPGAQVRLEKVSDHVVVFDGVAQPNEYFTQLRVADSNGVAHFSQLETGTYNYTVVAQGHETISSVEPITISSGQTQWTLPDLHALPGLVFVPNQALLSVVAGEQSYFTLKVRNEGPGHATNFSVVTPHDLPWISSGLPYTITELLAGESMNVTLFMNPPADMPASTYQKYIAVNALGVEPAILAATINVLDTDTGSLVFSVVDDYGLPVVGAYVVATNESGRTVINNGQETLVYDSKSGTTDENGNIIFTELPQGEYTYHVDAAGYYVQSNSVNVSAGSAVAGENGNQVNVQLANDPFSYSWTVEEITIEDSYAYTVTITVDDPTQPSLFVSPISFCPGDSRSFIISNGSAADIDNIVLTPDHDGVEFVINGTPVADSYAIGTIASGEAFEAVISTSAAGEFALDGLFKIFADYQLAIGAIPYQIFGNTKASCGAFSDPFGDWNWSFDGISTIGTIIGGNLPPFPINPPPASVPNEREGVSLILSGDATLERQAFNARLQMDSLTASVIENISINIVATDEYGQIAGGFAITPTIPTLLGDLQPSSTVVGEWLIVPGDLGITDTKGAIYNLVATIDYEMNGQSYSTETIPRQITVYPQPLVRLLFSTTQLDDEGDFTVAVVAQNDGYGKARNLTLDLSNFGVLVNPEGDDESLSFNLKSATIDAEIVDTEYIFRFGDLEPGATSVGHWTINVSAPNGSDALEEMIITGFDVSCHHRPYQGLELSALIDCAASEQTIIVPECTLANDDTCEEVGGPINTANGNYTYQQSTPVIHAVGDPLFFAWNYSSLNTGVSTEFTVLTSALGTGWTHNYQMFLDLAPVDSPEQVVVMRTPHGNPLKFYVVRDGYRPAPGVLATLTRTQVLPNSTIYTVTTVAQATYVFSETGQLLSQQDPQGNERLFIYNAAGQLSEVRDPVSGNYLSFTYLPDGKLASVSDPIFRATQFGYDDPSAGSGQGLGLLTTITDTNEHVWQYQYTQLSGGDYILSKIIDPEERIVEHTQFDDFGRAISQTFKGEQLQIAYFDDGRRIITDSLNQDEMHIYNSQNVLIGTIDAMDGVEMYVLDSNQNRVDVDDKLGNGPTAVRTPFGYSPVITNAAGFATHYEFNEFNDMLSTTDANLNQTTYEYDNSHNVITETNALEEQTTHTYNEWGLLTSTTDPSGATTEYGYNALGQLSVITSNLGLTTTYGYDVVGRTITTTDTLGKMTVNVYGDGDHLIRTTSNYLAGQPQNYLDKYNIVTEYGYDKSGYQTVVTNTVGQVNLTLRDDYGRVITSVTNYDGVTPISALCTDFTDPDPEYNICSLTGYNAAGQVVTSTNSLGIISVSEYDPLGRIVRTVRNWDDGIFDGNEPDRDIEQLTEYDAVGNTIIVTDTTGNMTRHFYNELNQGVGSILNWSGTITRVEELPTCFSLPADRETDICAMYAYDPVGNRTIVTDTVGHMTRTFYDPLNRAWATVENWNPATLTSPEDCILSADNRSTENICTVSGFDNQGRHITTTNALGQTSMTVYDAFDRPYLTVANWDGTPIQDVSDCHFPPLQSDTNLCSVTFYNVQGQRDAAQDPLGHLTEYGYDDMGRVVTTTRYLADGTPVRSITTYDLQGNRIAQENAGGYTTRYFYDSLSRLESTLTHEGVVITNTYNAAGQIVTTTNNLGHTTQSIYDDLGRLTGRIDGENNVIQFIYDALGNRVGVIDPNDKRTTYIFDSLNRQVGLIANDTGGPQTVDSNVLTRYEYDVFGNLVHVINAESITVSTRLYDDLNRLKQETDALNHSSYYEYDALGNTVVVTDANGAVTNYFYDGLNRVETVQYLADNTTVTTGYDALGNVLAMTDTVGTTTTEYDNLNRPVVITDALGTVVTQTFDLLGNRTHIIYPTGEVVTSTYDGDGRLFTVETWDGGLTSYKYDSVGHMEAMTLPNGVRTTAVYDHADRLTGITHTAPGGILLGQYEYQLDGNGLAEVITETLRSPEVAVLTDNFLESSGQVVMEAENGVTDVGSSHTWQPQTTQAGYGGEGYLRALPDVGALFATEELTGSAHIAFPLQISTPATYTVWVRGMASDAGGDSLYVGLDASTDSAQALTGFAPGEWSWASTTLSSTQATVDLTTSDTYTLDLWLREDGLRVDRVLLITDTNYIPSGMGPAVTPRDAVGDDTLAMHTITYGYDDLYRLTAANVSGDLVANYGYEYDVLGNREVYTATLESTVVTTYTYDIANRLQTAKANDSAVVWHYTYDNNGNRLSQIPETLYGIPVPADEVHYNYNQRNQLILVATDTGNMLKIQAEMVYDGRGNRLQAIAYPEGGVLTATYTVDPLSRLPLMVDNGLDTTLILYGQVAIGEYAVQTAEWTYYLGDSQLSVRQLVDEAGTVTKVQTYGPYGVLLHQSGDGGGLFGYKGGQSAANGLWYFGGGYFDPATGQFLSANGNPLLPLAATAMAHPGGFLFGPLLFVSWRRKGKKRIHPATLLFLGIMLTASLSSCGGGGGGSELITVIPIRTPDESGADTEEPAPGGTPAPPTPIATDEPPSIPIIPCPTPGSITRKMQQIEREYPFIKLTNVTSRPEIETKPWDMDELTVLEVGAANIVASMGLSKAQTALGTVEIYRDKGSCSNYRALAADKNYIRFCDLTFRAGGSSNISRESKKTIPHELGHIWDFRTGLALSSGIQDDDPGIFVNGVRNEYSPNADKNDNYNDWREEWSDSFALWVLINAGQPLDMVPFDVGTDKPWPVHQAYVQKHVDAIP